MELEAVKPQIRHAPYVNARGELIDNGTNREMWCGWEQRPTCPMCQSRDSEAKP